MGPLAPAIRQPLQPRGAGIWPVVKAGLASGVADGTSTAPKGKLCLIGGIMPVRGRINAVKKLQGDVATWKRQYDSAMDVIEDRAAIKELLKDAGEAARLGCKEQAVRLGKAAIASAALLVGQENAYALIIELFAEMTRDIHAKFRVLSGLAHREKLAADPHLIPQQVLIKMAP